MNSAPDLADYLMSRFRLMLIGMRDVHLTLRGRHQIENTGLAIQLAESLRSRGFNIPKPAIVNGIQATKHQGRLSPRCDGGSILLDGAHNPAAAQALRNYLDEFVAAPITLVFGGMSDKRLAEMAMILFPGVHRLILTRPATTAARLPVERSADAGGKIWFQLNGSSRRRELATPCKALRDVTPPEGTICVTGSLYPIGEVTDELVESPKPRARAGRRVVPVCKRKSSRQQTNFPGYSTAWKSFAAASSALPSIPFARKTKFTSAKWSIIPGAP